MADHYATLGIHPASSRAAIRSAYVRLMRCFHPDRNPSPEAAAKVREINAAYAVLGDAGQRAQYDRDQAAAWRPSRPEDASIGPIVERGPGAKESPWFALAAVSVLLLLLVPFYIAPLTSVPNEEAESRVIRPVRASQSGVPNRAQFIDDPCSSSAATLEVEQQLIGAAARMADQNGSLAIARLYKTLRLQLKGPEKNGRFAAGGPVSCVAAVALDLTPGVTLDAVRPGLIGTVAYDIHWANETGRSSIELHRDAKHLVRFLAGLATQAAPTTQTAQATPEPQAVAAPQATQVREAALNGMAPQTTRASVVARPRSASAKTQVSGSKSPVQVAEPSFSCSSARSEATRLICNSPQLAALDRQLAAAWGDTMARGSSSERARLLESDARFLARRDACSSEICVRAEYAAQIGQVRSVQGNQQP